MATYRIEWKPSALREPKRIDRQVIGRIVRAIAETRIEDDGGSILL